MRRIALFSLLLLISTAAIAQSTTGKIYGDVADNTGAILPSASVEIRDVHTGLTQKVNTNNSGEFTFNLVQPGDYAVTATAQGFRTESQTGVTVAANQNVHVTFELRPGAVTESVQVAADTTLVDTRESQVGETIDQERLESLPTLNRSTYDLVQLTPGVSTYTADTQIGSRDGAKFTVNGLPSDTVSNYIDGAYNNSYKQGGGNKVPNPDALEEFRLLTSNFNAEFGRSPGAVANVITRSGTSSFHGSAYDYVRNDVFNALNYFTAPGTKHFPYKQNQFGGTLGGPIPKLPQTFIFISYEQLILHQVATVNRGSIIVPTDLERKGDFSQSATKPVLAGGANCGTTAAPAICAAALDPVAQNVLKYVPHADSTGVAPQQSAASNDAAKQGLARADYNKFENHSIELMYFNSHGTDVAPLQGGNQIIGYSGFINQEDQVNTVLADTWRIGSRSVNSVRSFYTQNKYVISNQYQGRFLADLGSQAGEGGPIYAAPRWTINGLFNEGGVGAGPSNISQISFGIIDTVTMTRGRHNLTLGGSYVWNRYSEDGNATAHGIFTFSNNGSMNGATALSDFLQGKASSLGQSASIQHRTHQYDPALYVQDDWQAAKKLSLNLGLRWEMFPNHCCEPNYVGTFIANQQSTVLSSAPIGLAYIGDKNVAPELFNTSLLTFAPRVGFAYDVFGSGKTSIRGGFGVFYQTLEQFYNGTSQQLPFALNTTINQTPNLVQPYAGVSGGDPYPFVFDKAKARYADNSTTQVTQQNTGAPYVYEFNLTAEQQLTPAFAARVAYVGNIVHKNVMFIDGNPPVYYPNAANSTAGLNCRRPYEPYRVGGVSNSTTCTYAGYSGSAGPDPTQGKIFGAFNLRTPLLDSNYHSLQLSLRGRIGQRFNILGSYVWGKALSYDGPTVDNADVKKNHGSTDWDLRQKFVASYMYRIPDLKFGGAVGEAVLGGWVLNGVTTFQTGPQFTVTSGTDTNRDGNNNDRANIIGDPYTHASSRADKIKAFLNPANFSQPAFALSTDNPYGTEQRNSLRGPAFISTNLSIFKEFALYKSARFQFRAESFNLFGNVNLGVPRTNYSVFKALTSTQTQITTAGAPRTLQFAGRIQF
jgi:hypothetical protein